MTEYLVVYEQDVDGWSAYAPDLPGCVAAGASRAEVEDAMRTAVQMHLEALHADGRPIPAPTSLAGTVAA